jgi:hypothetical protein
MLLGNTIPQANNRGTCLNSNAVIREKENQLWQSLHLFEKQL